MSPDRHPDCPSDDVLQDIAAGTASHDTVVRSTAHISTCDFCAPLLKRYMLDFSDELSVEDAGFLSQLKTSSRAWQEQKAREIAPGLHPSRGAGSSLSKSRLSNWLKWPVLAPAGLAALAAVAIFEGPAMFTAFQNSQANKLVSRAYVERRTMEMRLPSVDYAAYQPLSTQLGSGDAGSSVNRPNLSIALGEVGKKLQSGAPKARDLETEGRLELLEGRKDNVVAARKAFEEAKERGLDTPALQTDLAASYFESEVLSHPDDPNLKTPINLLTEVVNNTRLKPDDEQRLAAMFDLALVYERSHMLDLARDTWEKYLKVDSTSGWAGEARAHLAKLPSGKQQSELRLDPEYFLAHQQDAKTRQDVEQYLEAGLTRWLPESFKNPQGHSALALQTLAALLASEHSDSWLQDFMAGLKPGDADAAAALGNALSKNQDDHFEAALIEARNAELKFRQRHNQAGEFRALYEQAYAYQRGLNGGECLSRAGPLAVRLQNARYPWLQSQTTLETAICSNFSGNSSGIDRAINSSEIISRNSRFPDLSFRILGVSAGIHRSQEPKCDKSWRDGIRALDQYWRGDYPPERLFQFYSVLAQCAEQTEDFHAAKALLSQAIAIQEKIGQQKPSLNNVTLRSTLLVYLANDMEALNEEAEAESAIRKADSLLANELNSAAASYRLTAKIRLADIEARRKRPDVALSTLMLAHELLPHINDRYLEMDYYRISGDIYLQKNALAEATGAYQKSIAIAEERLSDLNAPVQRLQWTVKTEPAYRGLTRVLLDQGRSEDAWKVWEWFRSRSMAAPESLATGKQDWPAIQKAMNQLHISPEMNTHVVFFTDSEAVNAWVVSSQGVKLHRIAVARSELDRLLNKFAEKCSVEDSSLEEVHALGKRLYTLLFAPLSEDIHEPAISVELDRPLQKLLVEALRKPDGQYMAESLQITYSPGVLVESNTLRKSIPITSRDRLAQLNGDGNVPGRKEILSSILRQFPNLTTVDGPKSDIKQVQDAILLSEILNYSGHGEEYETGAALILKNSPDETLLRAEDIPHSLPRMKLAILPACGTGLSDDTGLLDTANLVRPLLAAGVPQVIASRWNLEAGSTAQITETFFNHLGDGETTSLALQHAEKELLGKNNHPYYWAGLYLAGRNR